MRENSGQNLSGKGNSIIMFSAAHVIQMNRIMHSA